MRKSRSFEYFVAAKHLSSRERTEPADQRHTDQEHARDADDRQQIQQLPLNDRQRLTGVRSQAIESDRISSKEKRLRINQPGDTLIDEIILVR